MAKPRHNAAADYERLSDRQLADLARTGDHHAFRAIMLACNQRLFRIARSVVQNEFEAEDVLQEAYLRAFTNLDSFRGDSSLLTWLTTITLNEARGRLRRRRPTVELSEVEAAQNRGAEVITFPSARSNPEENFSRAQMRRLLEHAVDSLPEPYRLVFIMRDVEECTIEETAKNLKLRPETVKTRLFRARRLLRQALHEKLSGSLKETFHFAGDRCSRITEAVLNRLTSRIS